MKINGINYDTGFFVGEDSRPDFDEATAAREMRVIAEDLHCTAVRISGGDPARIEAAAAHAAEAGLQVWFAPFPVDLDPGAMVELMRDSASRAENLRNHGADVVLLTGCEISLFGAGLISGANLLERITTLMTAGPGIREIQRNTQECLNEMAAVSRATFGGPISYASGVWEDVDWTAFDIVGLNATGTNRTPPTTEHVGPRAPARKARRRHRIRLLHLPGRRRPGRHGLDGRRPTADPPLDGTLERDEQEQVDYFTQSMQAFEETGMRGAFWFTFGLYTTVRRDDDPTRDTDLASYGVVAMLPPAFASTRYTEMRWEPKPGFDAMARLYGKQAAHV